MFALLAQHHGTWGIGEISVTIIIVAAIIAVVFVITRAMGVPIPGWVITVFWIVVAAFVAIVAIRFLLTL
jgi:hypothetical protein